MPYQYTEDQLRAIMGNVPEEEKQAQIDKARQSGIIAPPPNPPSIVEKTKATPQVLPSAAGNALLQMVPEGVRNFAADPSKTIQEAKDNPAGAVVGGVKAFTNHAIRANTYGFYDPGFGAKEPPKDSKGEGDSGEVQDSIPPGAASAAGVHNRPAGGGGVGAGGLSPYDKSLADWKMKQKTNFEQYVQTPSDELRHAEEEKGNIAERQGNDAGDLMARQRADSEALFKQQQEEEAARNAELEDRLAKLQQANDEVSNMNVSVKNFWSSRSAAQNAVGIFASALSVAAKGPSLIDKAISQDLELQKENIDNKRKGLDYSKSIYNSYYQVTQDKRVAALAAKIHLEESAKSELTEMAARHGGEREKANAASHVAQIDQAIGDNRMKLEAILNPPPARPTGGGGGAGAAPPKWDFTTTVTNLPGMPEGTGIQANTAEEAKELRESADAARQTAVDVARLQELRKNNPGSLLNPYSNESQEYEAIRARAQLNAKKASGSGNNDNRSEAKIDKTVIIPDRKSAIGDAAGITAGNKQLEDLNRRTQEQFQKKVQAAGLPVVQIGVMQDKKTGQTVRTGSATPHTSSTYNNPLFNQPGKK